MRGTESEKERKFVRIQHKQLKVGTEIETWLQMARPVTQHTDFTKAFFTIRMSYGFSRHTSKCHGTYAHKQNAALVFGDIHENSKIGHHYYVLQICHTEFETNRQ